MRSDGSFKNKDAQNIAYRVFIPDRPKSVIVFVHGLGEHLRKYDYFGERAHEKGVAFFSYDQRGHGRSQGRRCHVGRFSDLVDDLRQAVEIAKVESLCDRAYPVGTSLGGLVSLTYAIEYGNNIKGVAACAPALRFYRPPSGIETGVAEILASVAPWITTPNRIPFEYLTHDHEMLEHTKRDKLSQRFLTFRTFLEMKKAMRSAFDNAGSLSVPALLIHGRDDKVIDSGGTQDFYDRIGSSDKELRMLEGMYHELLRETSRSEIIDYILGWVLKESRA